MTFDLIEPDPTKTCPKCGTSWVAEIDQCPECPGLCECGHDLMEDHDADGCHAIDWPDVEAIDCDCQRTYLPPAAPLLDADPPKDTP